MVFCESGLREFPAPEQGFEILCRRCRGRLYPYFSPFQLLVKLCQMLGTQVLQLHCSDSGIDSPEQACIAFQ